MHFIFFHIFLFHKADVIQRDLNDTHKASLLSNLVICCFVFFLHFWICYGQKNNKYSEYFSFDFGMFSISKEIMNICYLTSLSSTPFCFRQRLLFLHHHQLEKKEHRPQSVTSSVTHEPDWLSCSRVSCLQSFSYAPCLP